MFAKLLAMLVQHRVLLLGCWDEPYRSLVKAAQVARQTVHESALALAGQYSLRRVLHALRRQMHVCCRISTRKKHPSTAQLLLKEVLT